jgi:hypothetical protein
MRKFIALGFSGHLYLVLGLVGLLGSVQEDSPARKGDRNKAAL